MSADLTLPGTLPGVRGVERPILFSGPLVRAILDGRKTQTRRLMKSQNFLLDGGGHPYIDAGYYDDAGWRRDIRCPFGFPGDRLWVRETWAEGDGDSGETTLYYAASDGPWTGPWRPSTHMPRWAARLFLTVESVRVERLQAITEEDARAEGIEDGGCLNCGEPEPCGCANPEPSARESFVRLWDSLTSDGSRWVDNPWVWVVTFKREGA